jgi:hypothetical protein
MQPWQLFHELFQVQSMPYVVNDHGRLIISIAAVTTIAEST